MGTQRTLPHCFDVLFISANVPVVLFSYCQQGPCYSMLYQLDLYYLLVFFYLEKNELGVPEKL